VSGHRHLANIESVITGVDEALQNIKAAFGGDHMTIISPLAEGADRVVVWRAMAEYQVRLVVPLPLELSNYMDDFNSISSKTEFVTLLEQADEVFELPAAESREACYLAAGMYILNTSDVLIAIWDGLEARGPGGTGDIVQKARRRDMPLVWIQTERTASKSDHPVQVHYERFPIHLLSREEYP
jgi:hypothetical protein